MSFSSQEDPSNFRRRSGMSQKLQDASIYYAQEHSEVSIIILHMSELLSSFVREEAPEEQAQWSRALADVRKNIEINPSQFNEELSFAVKFSVMLEEGLQCIANKCAKLEQAVKNGRPLEYVTSTSSRALFSPTSGAIWAVKRRNDGKPQLVACDLCDGAIPRPRYYNHLRTVHPKEFEKIAKFRCEYCKHALFIRETPLRAHLEVCEKRLEVERINNRMPPSHQLICRMCEHECATLKELAVHSEQTHPHCQILTCTGCAVLFRQPEQLVEHWRVAKQQFKHSRCATGAPAALIPRAKLIAQMLARAKAAGNAKNFAYIACMTQNIACQECGVICDSFIRLYGHIHTKHNKIVQAALSYGCLGCGSKYRCSPSLREHLLRSEIEGYTRCNNAGAAYWNEQVISKDLRPPSQEGNMNESTMTAIEKENEGKAKVKVEPFDENRSSRLMVKKIKIEEPDQEYESGAGRAEGEMNKRIKITLKRAPAGMEVIAARDSLDDMPALDQWDEMR